MKLKKVNMKIEHFENPKKVEHITEGKKPSGSCFLGINGQGGSSISNNVITQNIKLAFMKQGKERRVFVAVN